MTGLGPFDLGGQHFLLLYGALFVIALISGHLLQERLRPEGAMPSRIDTEMLAMLAGGPARFAEAVAAGLLADGRLAVQGRTALAGTPGALGSPAERRVLALPAPFDWSAVVSALADPAESVRAAMVRAGLLVDRATGLKMRFAATAPLLALMVLGGVKLLIGEARGRPVGFLSIALFLTAMVAILRFVAHDARTDAGRAALADYQDEAERLRRAPTADEAALGVALFGTGILVGSGWEPLHHMRAASSGNGGGGCSTSSDGGGGGGGGDGGGGGGCGGCGS